MEKESNHIAREKVKLEDEVKKLKNLVEELKADAIEKDTNLDHLRKSSVELCSSLGKAREEAIREFRASNVFTIYWTRIMQLGLRTFAWTLLNPSLGWILTSSSFPLQLKALCFKQV